jgi:hypothetical protein
MTTRRSAVETWLDLAVYAPIGLLIELQRDVPRLAEVGRRELEQRVTVAKFVGQMAVAYGRRQFEQQAAPQPAAMSAPVDVVVVDGPFGGYDALSAAEIVQRLTSLDGEVLAAVAEYETAHRARRTVLAKVAQLRSKR